MGEFLDDFGTLIGLVGLLIGFISTYVGVRSYIGSQIASKTSHDAIMESQKAIKASEEAYAESQNAYGKALAAVVDADKSTEDLTKSVRILSQQTFDPVTYRLIENHRRNTSLADRMKLDGVREKKALAIALIRSNGKPAFLDLIVVETPGEPQPIFLESGSTLAYLGLALSEANYVSKFDHPLLLTTNNVLVAQTLVFVKKISPRLLGGTPIGRYGATFGDGSPAEEPANLVQMWKSTKPQPGTRPEQIGGFDSQRYYIGAESQYEQMGKDIEEFFRDGETTPTPSHLLIEVVPGNRTGS